MNCYCRPWSTHQLPLQPSLTWHSLLFPKGFWGSIISQVRCGRSCLLIEWKPLRGRRQGESSVHWIFRDKSAYSGAQQFCSSTQWPHPLICKCWYESVQAYFSGHSGSKHRLWQAQASLWCSKGPFHLLFHTDILQGCLRLEILGADRLAMEFWGKLLLPCQKCDACAGIERESSWTDYQLLNASLATSHWLRHCSARDCLVSFGHKIWKTLETTAATQNRI